MSITPQAIKDQEFQVKFRGYDTLEVKAYLELLAEEFFELHEQTRKMAEEGAGLASDVETLQREKEEAQRDGRKRIEELENLKDEIKRQQNQTIALQKEVDELRGKLDSSLKETELAKEMVESAEERMKSEQAIAAAKLQEERDEAEARRAAENESAQQIRLEIEKLRHEMKILEEQNRELKKGEADFKTAIVAAQKFSEDLKKRAEKEARQIMERAKTDVENFRKQAHEELSRLPVEIEKLHKKRNEIRGELKMVLESYLHNLDIFSEVKEAEREEDLSELFQSIQLPDDGEIDRTDVEDLNLKLA
ncbi:MAG: DivIVA domain-containing protein [Desulfobulbaceae bacterium]|nr:MAG: DivIVA domain-containing protein [Desulfobulbaceae bacterium]